MGKVVVCETLLKPQEISIPSSQGDGSYYTVVSPTLFNDPVCDCKGFQFRGSCKHISWVERDGCKFYRHPTQEELQGAELGRCPGCYHPLILYELDPEFDG